jgi:hypothetical protein
VAFCFMLTWVCPLGVNLHPLRRTNSTLQENGGVNRVSQPVWGQLSA